MWFAAAIIVSSSDWSETMKASMSAAAAPRPWPAEITSRIRARLAAAANGPWPALLVVSLAGWAALIGGHCALVAPIYCGSFADDWLASGWEGVIWAFLLNSPDRLALSWLLMLLATMPPLLVQPIAHLWGRRLAPLRAIAIFVAAYAAIWMLAGIVLTAAAILLKELAGANAWTAPILAAAIAALWQASPPGKPASMAAIAFPRFRTSARRRTERACDTRLPSRFRALARAGR
jgi:hypothetical protein